MKKYLIAIPIYNEEQNIDNVFKHLFHYIDLDCVDILAIDDGSEDGSLSKLRQYSEIKFIRNQRNFGYGFSIQTAFNYALKQEYEFLITMDADGQHLPQAIPEFIYVENNADIISGSRYMHPENHPGEIIKSRFEINKHITGILNRITGFNLTDSFCGMKLYRVEKLKHFKTSDHYYSMPLQVIIQAWHNKLTWKEIKIPLLYIDNQRNFNNLFEHDNARLQYYLETIKLELEKLGYEKNSDIWTAS